jgi:anaerobic selenocysteine-containing dehydrogenase
MDLRRRDVLKTIGLVTAGSLLPGCQRDVHNLVPFVLPDEEIIPGVANWYASTCQECQAGCGVIVRVMEGRAKKIEGNPDHPVNHGKLCAHGQAALQGLYNPDRVQGAMRRRGERGQGRFEPISWQEGIELWVDRLRSRPNAAAMVSRPLPGTLGELLAQFMQALNGRLVLYDTMETAAQRRAMHMVFGSGERLPYFDLARTDYLLSFGAPFLEHWLSPVQFGVGYGTMRQGRPGKRGRVVQVEPRLSLTGANADRWIPVHPGSEQLVALAIGAIIMKDRLARPASVVRARLQALYDGLSLQKAADASGVSIDELRRLAVEFTRAPVPLAIAGGMAASHTNGTRTLIAVNALNLLVGHPGLPGGLQFIAPPDFPGRPHVNAERDLLDLAEEIRTGRRAVLQLYGVNPLFTLPPSSGLASALERAEFIVSFSPFLDETAAMADLILPDHTPLESWGDHLHADLAPVKAIGLQQPVVKPLYDTRSIGDVLLEAAHRLGSPVAERLPWVEFRALLQHNWHALAAKQPSTAPFSTYWVHTLQRGGRWEEEADPLQPRSPSFALPGYEPPRFTGEAAEFPLFFYPYPSLALHDGRGANRPWLQELPDPLTTAVWGSWVELNPDTARRHGFEPGDIVRVTSPLGSVEAPLIYVPGLHPSLLCMPRGQGHWAYGRYATGRGVNPLVLLAPTLDPLSGSLATASTRVRVERIRRGRQLVMLDDLGQQPSALGSRMP